jgi:peroxiredoxin
MQAKYQARGFKVIAVNLDKDQALAKKFLENNPAKFDVGYDPQGSLASQLKVKGMPSSFLINRDGEIVSSHIGFLEKDTGMMEKKIQSLLSK